MRIKDVIREIELFAPPQLQESYDNAGVQVGDVYQQANGALLCLDITEEVVEEALELGCNLIISHHPLIFKPLKSLTGSNYIERCVIKACQHDLVIYSAHTNLDSVQGGVSFRLAEKLGLQNVRVLSPRKPAYDYYALANDCSEVGFGVVGELPEDEDEIDFLNRMKAVLHLQCVKHSTPIGRKVKEIAICGGSGASLIAEAMSCGADVYITGEAKYNDYYDVEDRMLLAVIGHYESEVCTKDIFYDIITEKFPTFAVHFSNVNSNPIKYI